MRFFKNALKNPTGVVLLLSALFAAGQMGPQGSVHALAPKNEEVILSSYCVPEQHLKTPTRFQVGFQLRAQGEVSAQGFVDQPLGVHSGILIPSRVEKLRGGQAVAVFEGFTLQFEASCNAEISGVSHQQKRTQFHAAVLTTDSGQVLSFSGNAESASRQVQEGFENRAKSGRLHGAPAASPVGALGEPLLTAALDPQKASVSFGKSSANLYFIAVGRDISASAQTTTLSTSVQYSVGFDFSSF